MEIVITGDGSSTLYSEKFKQIYHSKSGAVEESVEKFVRPCMKFKDKHPKILDICFGLGYNSAAALDLLGECEIIGLEDDPLILRKILDTADYFVSYPLIKKAAKKGEMMQGGTSIRIILGDALKTIKQIEQRFDIVFLDPFSPAACPELWTPEFIADIYAVIRQGGILTTYSCARKVRDALKSAGFEVRDGPVVGRRAPATIAVKQ